MNIEGIQIHVHSVGLQDAMNFVYAKVSIVAFDKDVDAIDKDAAHPRVEVSVPLPHAHDWTLQEIEVAALQSTRLIVEAILQNTSEKGD